MSALGVRNSKRCPSQRLPWFEGELSPGHGLSVLVVACRPEAPPQKHAKPKGTPEADTNLPSSHYYLGSLSWTSRTFYFPDSLDHLEVLGGLSWQRERPQGGSPRVREDPLGTPPTLSAKKVSENLEKGPENLGSRRSWRSKIMNPINNDYWVAHRSTFRFPSEAP